MDKRIPIAPTRLDQYDMRRRVLGETICEYAPSRTRANDDIIRLHAGIPPWPNIQQARCHCANPLPTWGRWFVAPGPGRAGGLPISMTDGLSGPPGPGLP